MTNNAQSILNQLGSDSQVLIASIMWLLRLSLTFHLYFAVRAAIVFIYSIIAIPVLGILGVLDPIQPTTSGVRVLFKFVQ